MTAPLIARNVRPLYDAVCEITNGSGMTATHPARQSVDQAYEAVELAQRTLNLGEYDDLRDLAACLDVAAALVLVTKRALTRASIALAGAVQPADLYALREVRRAIPLADSLRDRLRAEADSERLAAQTRARSATVPSLAEQIARGADALLGRADAA